MVRDNELRKWTLTIRRTTDNTEYEIPGHAYNIIGAITQGYNAIPLSDVVVGAREAKE